MGTVNLNGIKTGVFYTAGSFGKAGDNAVNIRLGHFQRHDIVFGEPHCCGGQILDGLFVWEMHTALAENGAVMVNLQNGFCTVGLNCRG